MVIAIIGILAGILIPAVGAVRESSHSATCVSNLRQITAASLLYANEHKGIYPTQGPQPGSPGGTWFVKIAPELGYLEGMDAERDLGALQCPSALAQHTPGRKKMGSEYQDKM